MDYPLTLPGQFLDAPDPPNQEFIQDIRDKINQKPLRPTNHLKLFLKTGNGPKKNRKRTLKKGETDQQTENLKLFLKTGNGPIKMRKPIKINGKRIKC